MRRLVVILCALSCMLTLISEDRASAIAFNDQGFELYEEGNFAAALKKFEASWRADGSYIYGHYNYACTLGILIREEPMDWYHMQDAAFDHLERTLEIRPSYASKMLTDSDLSELRKDFRFYSILGYDVSDPEEAAFVLSSLSWYGAPTSGIFPYTAGAEFYSDGSFEFWFYTPDWFESFADEDIYRVDGRYRSREGGVVEMELDDPMRRKSNLDDIFSAPELFESRTSFVGTLSPAGELNFEIFDYSFFSVYERFSA